jgi:hypothetical protein
MGFPNFDCVESGHAAACAAVLAGPLQAAGRPLRPPVAATSPVKGEDAIMEVSGWGAPPR